VETCDGTRQATEDYVIWRMHIACRLPKATDTHAEYGIFIAVPLLQWLGERTSAVLHMHLRALFISTLPLQH